MVFNLGLFPGKGLWVLQMRMNKMNENKKSRWCFLDSGELKKKCKNID